MYSPKIRQADNKDKHVMLEQYEHYIAVDWSQKTMAIARLTPMRKDPIIFERETDLKELQQYLSQLQGSKVLVIEETTSAHWLYLELRSYVDRIIICDPFHNRLLSSGPKTDKIDAGKLCVLLRAGLLVEVFHRDDELFRLRRLVSAYNDLVSAGVRAKNQHSAVMRAEGFPTEIPKETPLQFVVGHLDKSIELYVQAKAEYEKQFDALCKKNPTLKALKKLDGIGNIGAVKILVIVVDARRFPNAGHYLSYCGLVQLVKMSGGRKYGERTPRYNHQLKAVYKIAVAAALTGKNPLREYYEFLRSKGVAEHLARHTVARYLAKVSYGMLKHGTEYEPYRWKKPDSEK